MPSPVRPYLGESAVDRVAGRRRKLLDAGFELMASEGFAHVTIDSLCKAAQLNKRYFYESFPDLDALVAAIVDELATELTSRTVGAATEAAVRSLDLTGHIGIVFDPIATQLVLNALDPSRARTPTCRFVPFAS